MSIFITGGAGFLGSHLVEFFYGKEDITVYSRDEAKHYYLQKRFPKIKCVVGDVRNYDLMKRSSAGHKFGIFTASLKQIGSVDQNPEEAVKIIIDGSLNSKRISIENKFESSVFISTDKSRAATTLYGAMKFVAGESFIVNAEESDTRLNTAIYGNVTNSTGSIIPLIWDSIRRNYSLQLYGQKMTRFMIDIDDAVSLVDYSLFAGNSGYNIIPKLKSYYVKDLMEIYSEEKGLKFTIGEPRISEKLHEIMIAKEELPRVKESTDPLFDKDYYLMHYKNIFNSNINFKNDEFSSENSVISKNELKAYLIRNNFYE